MANKDKELEAISSIISLLTPLDGTERTRVLEYVLKRLDMATVSAPAMSAVLAGDPEQTPPAQARFPVKDIRSFTAEKQPRSANDMALVVAYYLAELAPDGERSETVNTDLLKRYFKMANFPLPSMLKNVLPNAAAGGYLNNVSRGEYKLNPVGYNLVVHGLPRGAASSTVTITRRKGSVRRRASRK